jgi:predicted dehydrogenase
MAFAASIALVGCGAITENFYIPALCSGTGYAERIWLVDPSADRLAFLTSKYSLRTDHAVGSIADLPDSIVGAVNATPSHLHLATSLELIKRKIALFVEKPLAETAREASEMLEAAARERVPVSANQYRRRYPASLEIRDYIQSGRLGKLRRLVWHEGGKFEWPTFSGFYFRRPWPDNQPRGALLDTGAHIVDLVCWWLGEKPSVTEARTDSFGGPEGFVAIKGQGAGAEIDIKISFLSKLRNEIVIEGESGSIRCRPYEPRRFYFRAGGGPEQTVNVGGPDSRAAVATELMGNFDEVAAHRTSSLLIDAVSVLPSLKFIDEAYEAARHDLPSYYRDWVGSS